MFGLPSKEHVDERQQFRTRLREYVVNRLWPVQKNDGMHWQDIDVMNALLDCAELTFGLGRSDHDEWCSIYDGRLCGCHRGKLKKKLENALGQYLSQREVEARNGK